MADLTGEQRGTRIHRSPHLSERTLDLDDRGVVQIASCFDPSGEELYVRADDGDHAGERAF